MKKLFRTVVGHVAVFPFVSAYKLLSLFLGEEKAVNIVGPKLTRSAVRALRFWIPTINDADDFDRFPAKMKKKFPLWEPLYDIEIIQEDSNVFQLHVNNCPFCEALSHWGMSKVSPYICEGDWAVAREQAAKWTFERSHQVGTGDSFCDHTYKRKIDVKPN